MKKKRIIKIFIFILLLVMTILLLNSIFQPYNANFDKLKIYYQYPKNTFDLIFYGNSHNDHAYIPMIFNETLQCDSINLAVAGGRLEQAYFIMKETLKDHQPKVMVLEAFAMTPYDINEYVPHLIHHSFDTMHFSKNKIDAIKYNVPNGDKLEFYLPLLTYHLRWKEEDFIKDTLMNFTSPYQINPYYGARLLMIMKYKVENDPLHLQSIYTEEKLILPNERMEMFENIAKLCQENDVQLIVVGSPYITQSNLPSEEIHMYLNGIEQLAKDYSIDIIDLNTIADEIEIYKGDLSDDGHLNISGATKASQYLSNYIREKYGDLFRDVSYDLKEETADKLFYHQKYLELFLEKKERNFKASHLQAINYQHNLNSILQQLDDEQYITIISTKNLKEFYPNSVIKESLVQLGFPEYTPLEGDINFIGINYNEGNQLEYKLYSQDSIQVTNITDKTLQLPFTFDIISSSDKTGYRSSIIINDQEYSLNKEGFNIVVYDKLLEKIVFNSNFNTDKYIQYDLKEYYTEISSLIYQLNLEKALESSKGIEESYPNEEGLIIKSNSLEPSFSIRKFSKKKKIVVEIEIVAPAESILSIFYYHEYDTKLMEEQKVSTQLVTGYNIITLYLESYKEINQLEILLGDQEGEYIIKQMSIYSNK